MTSSSMMAQHSFLHVDNCAAHMFNAVMMMAHQNKYPSKLSAHNCIWEKWFNLKHRSNPCYRDLFHLTFFDAYFHICLDVASITAACDWTGLAVLAQIRPICKNWECFERRLSVMPFRVIAHECRWLTCGMPMCDWQTNWLIKIPVNWNISIKYFKE